MSEQVMGTYEGEGTNVSGSLKTAANVPDMATQSASGGTATGQGKTGAVALTRRRQMRVSSESAQSAAAINYGGGDQILTACARGIYITTSGTLVLRMKEDSADQTFSGLLAGQYYPFAVALIRQTSSTAAGLLLF